MNLRFQDMVAQHLDEVVNIEREVHAYPWTLGNFVDSLREGNLCKVLKLDERIIGFVVMMFGVDDAEILDIAIAREQQRKGLGKIMMQRMLDYARGAGKSRVVLEVRESNLPARALYEQLGFVRIGLRRAYYPADEVREDAILMGYEL
jgi:ribosomal-protein-alanine acetyltransferase